jgi:hypothetical protein
MGNWVNFSEERCLTFTFSWVRNINFVQNHLLKVNVRKIAAFVRESFMLETRGCSNLVNILNSVCSLKEN